MWTYSSHTKEDGSNIAINLNSRTTVFQEEITRLESFSKIKVSRFSQIARRKQELLTSGGKRNKSSMESVIERGGNILESFLNFSEIPKLTNKSNYLYNGSSCKRWDINFFCFFESSIRISFQLNFYQNCLSHFFF